MTIDIQETLTKFTDAALEKIAKQNERIEGLDRSITELAQKSATADDYQPMGHKASPLAGIGSNEGVKALASGQSKNTVTVALNAGVGILTKAAITSGTYPVESQRLATLGANPQRPLRLLDVLPSVPMASGSAQYVRLGAYANAAGYQIAEGDLKPEATVPTSLITVEAATIAHWVPVSAQVLADSPALDQQLRGLLLFGLADKLERELLNGPGTAGTIAGLSSVAAIYTHTATAAADRIGQAGAALSAFGWVPSVVILNPADWFKIASERGAEGYVAGGWNQPARPNLWGMDVVISSAQPAGTAIVADTSQMAILDRQNATVDIGYTGTQFTSNMLTVRAELRAALAIYSPSAVTKVSLTA
ncbi:MAG: phage major capsid protein [Stenotrophomonas sp.]